MNGESIEEIRVIRWVGNEEEKGIGKFRDVRGFFLNLIYLLVDLRFF